MKSRIFMCLLVISIFGISTQYVVAEDFDWPRWRGPNGNGISMETDWNPEALAEGPKLSWTKDVGAGHSNVAIQGEFLYTMGGMRRPVVYCLDKDTGVEVWTYSFKEWSGDAHATPTIDGKFVYALTGDGLLACLKMKNGKAKWKIDLLDEYDVDDNVYSIAGSPVIEGDLLLLNVNINGMAFNKTTGKMIWTSPKCDRKEDHPGWSTPVLFDYNGKRCFTICNDDDLCIVEAETGDVIFKHELASTGTCTAADPIVFNNKLFTTTGYNIGCELLDLTDQDLVSLWKNKNMKNYFSSPVIVEGHIYGNDKSLVCIDSKTGDLMWRGERNIIVSVTAAVDKLIVIDEHGRLLIVKATADSFQEISSCQLPSRSKRNKWWTPPVLNQGRIYCRNWYGDLVCIDVSE